MKTFKESVLNFKCVNGCGVSIYNATHNYNGVCPECGGKLKTIKPIKKEK
jgi:hypothetical protein